MSIETNPSSDFVLGEAHFAQIKTWLYEASGIDLKPGKESLVKNRLTNRLRILGLSGFDAYLRYIEQDASHDEMAILIDSMTTNKTSFFRETPHFEYIAKDLLPAWSKKTSVRIWSAGCSSGEEPYSLAMLFLAKLSKPSAVRILATDISDTILSAARKGTYRKDQVADVPTAYKTKYLQSSAPEEPPLFTVKQEARNLVRFASLNLMGSWPMKGPFDLILCRNVMIYFDHPTQERLINRYYDMLAPGGHLFIGHSESLSSTQHSFDYVQPAVYRR
ncbi:MAG: chemotaxis protein methyltransferase CheR [Candidatus Latescibacterota bacterium]|jgi:chemotaxis protein methyltransferase CheR